MKHEGNQVDEVIKQKEEYVLTGRTPPALVNTQGKSVLSIFFAIELLATLENN